MNILKAPLTTLSVLSLSLFLSFSAQASLVGGDDADEKSSEDQSSMVESKGASSFASSESAELGIGLNTMEDALTLFGLGHTKSYYQIVNYRADEVASGSVDLYHPEIDFSKLPTGKYFVRVKGRSLPFEVSK